MFSLQETNFFIISIQTKLSVVPVFDNGVVVVSRLDFSQLSSIKQFCLESQRCGAEGKCQESNVDITDLIKYSCVAFVILLLILMIVTLCICVKKSSDIDKSDDKSLATVENSIIPRLIPNNGHEQMFTVIDDSNVKQLESTAYSPVKMSY